MNKELEDFLKECIKVWDNKLKTYPENVGFNIERNWLIRIGDKAEELLEEKTLTEKFIEISIWEIAKFWIKTYPADIFDTGPYPVPEIRDLFTELLEMRRY